MKICLVAHLAYGAMKGGADGHAGGVEHQTTLMARWLASREHHVSLVTWDEGGGPVEYIHKVRVIKLCRQNAGIRGVRFFHPRWTSLQKALNDADADIYYHNCAEYVTGQLALWCKVHSRHFIYSVASDAECELISAATPKLRDKVFFRYGLRNADTIIVQTGKQQQLLRSNFDLDSVILPLPNQGPRDYESQKALPPEQRKAKILWVGRIDKEKRLELLLEIAAGLPEIRFDIAGKPSNPRHRYYQSLLTKAATLPNVAMHGMIPRSNMAQYYSNAALLCCTSLYEGFPNTFIEAWSHGLPVVSTFDPDNLIANNRLGIFATSAGELVAAIRQLMESPEDWLLMSNNARQYYLKNHSLDTSMQKFENVFRQSWITHQNRVSNRKQCHVHDIM